MKDMWKKKVSVFRLKLLPHIKHTMTEIQYRILSEDIANIFYINTDRTKEEGLNSSKYWEHVNTIEDVIQRFMDNDDLTLN